MQLLEAMRLRNMTDAKLAAKTGLPRMTFWRLRVKGARPNIGTRLVIANALDMSPAHIEYPADAGALPFPLPPPDDYLLRHLDATIIRELEWARVTWREH